MSEQKKTHSQTVEERIKELDAWERRILQMPTKEEEIQTKLDKFTENIEAEVKFSKNYEKIEQLINNSNDKKEIEKKDDQVDQIVKDNGNKKEIEQFDDLVNRPTSKEAQLITDALKSNDPKKIEELIKHVDSKKEFNQTADYKFDKKEAQQFADALQSNDPKKIEELIKHVDSKKGLNQTADYKFDKKEAQQFADALKSKDISKIPNTISKEESKEESKEFLEKVGTEKSSLNKLLAQSGQQLDMATLNNAMEISNIQQNKSSQER